MIYRISLGLVGLLAMGWTALAAGEPSAMEGWSAKGAAQLDSDTGTFHGSGPSLRMTISDGSGGISRPIMPFPIAPFSVSGAVKVEGNFEFSQVAVQFFNASRKQVGWKPIAPLKSGKDWTTFQSEVTPVPEATVALLVVAAKGKGTIWLDEMAISTDGAPAAAPVVAEKPAVSEAAPLPVKVAADDSHLLYEGRFDLTNPKAPRCSWPASSVTLKFKGQTANVEMTGKANVRWQVYVDGQPTDVLINNGKPQVLALAKDLPAGEHTIQLLKRTEAMVGSASIAGFQLADGSELLAPDKPKRKIEVIGDSISAGFGDEAKDQYQKFTPETEHAGIAYGALAARDLGAEYMCIAWSGKKMWPNNTIPELYDEIIPTEPGKKWDFSK